MGKRLELFKDMLAEKISSGLAKPIKIQTITQKGMILPRVIERLKSIGSLPLITIYAGMSEEFNEKRFHIKDIPKIKKNFKLYDDLKVQTLLSLYPHFSKFIYHPVDYVVFKKDIEKDSHPYNLKEDLKRRIFTFKLFERELKEMIDYVKENNSFLISITTPLNLELMPNEDCIPKLDEFTQKKLTTALETIKGGDFKGAYSKTKELTLIANNSPKVHFIHGKLSKKIGKFQEAKNSLTLSSALDCDQSQGNPIFNEILTRVSNQNGSLVFDFQNMIYSSWTENELFESKLYPQNLYYQKLSSMLAIKIKRILKL